MVLLWIKSWYSYYLILQRAVSRADHCWSVVILLYFRYNSTDTNVYVDIFVYTENTRKVKCCFIKLHKQFKTFSLERNNF